MATATNKKTVAPPSNEKPTPAPAGARVTPPTQSNTHDQIARRAFEIWQARGGGDGSHEQDWYQAERELKLGRQ
jgi:hypothetical protein